MIKDFGLLAIVFALVPGYIADVAYRACWGMPKGDEFDRSLRAIIWSVCGLVFYTALLGGLPNYIRIVAPEAGAGLTPPKFNWTVAAAFALDVVLSSAAAIGVGATSEWKWGQEKFAKVFRRSPTFEAPWDAVWRRFASGRTVRVIMKDGPSYLGQVFIVSQRSDEQELVLYDPGVIDEKSGAVTPVEGTRFVYVRNEEIREIHFSYTLEEQKNARGQIAETGAQGALGE